MKPGDYTSYVLKSVPKPKQEPFVPPSMPEAERKKLAKFIECSIYAGVSADFSQWIRLSRSPPSTMSRRPDFGVSIKDTA